LAADGVGERGGGAAAVDLRLRALGLQLAENARELADLLLVEIELVGEKAQWPPHAEGAGPELVVLRGRVDLAPAMAARAPITRAVSARTALGKGVTTAAAPVGLPPVQHTWMHHRSSSRRGSSHPAGLKAWAPCLTHHALYRSAGGLAIPGG